MAALAGENITQLAKAAGVSRKFIYQQKRKALEAIEQAFAAPDSQHANEKNLFECRMTKPLLEQLILSMILCGRSSYRAVQRIIADVFDYSVSLGKISQLVEMSAKKASEINLQRDLSAIQIACHDEFFHRGNPFFVVVEPFSRYCILLSQGKACTEEEWSQALRSLSEQGYDPTYTVADGGKPLRSGINQVFPDTPCYYDLFHLCREFGQAILAFRKDEQQRRASLLKAKERITRYGLRRCDEDEENTFLVLDQLTSIIEFDVKAITTLKKGLGRLRHKALSLSATYSITKREAFYNKTLDEMLDLLRINPIIKFHASDLYSLLCNQKDNLLGLFRRTDEVERVRSSSMVENFNFSVRQQLQGQASFDDQRQNLQRFYLNHRRFLAAHSSNRKNRSPAELLDSQTLPHWLELLGYKRFRQTVT